MRTAAEVAPVAGLRAWAWYAGRFLFLLYLRGLFRWRAEGRQHLPSAGPCILYANHAHWLDIPIVAVASTRRIRFMAKRELFSVPVLGPFIRCVGAFPVNRGQPDKRAVREALQILAGGEVLGIFPEGTRSKDGRMLKPEPGLAYLAYKSGAPVVPMAISSSYRWFAPITVRIGRPIQVTEDLGPRPGSDELSAAAERLMQAVAALMVPG